MNSIKSYQTLKDISTDLAREDHFDRVHEIFWSKCLKIQSDLIFDLKTIFNNDFCINNVEFIYDDPSYKQSATAIIFHAILINNSELKLKIECLVDHSKIRIGVKNRSQENKGSEIMYKIDSICDNEGFVNLSEFINNR